MCIDLGQQGHETTTDNAQEKSPLLKAWHPEEAREELDHIENLREYRAFKRGPKRCFQPTP